MQKNTATLANYTPAQSLDVILSESEPTRNKSKMERRLFLASDMKNGVRKPEGTFACMGEEGSPGISGPAWRARDGTVKHFWYNGHAIFSGSHRQMPWKNGINVIAVLTGSVALSVAFFRSLVFSQEMFNDRRYNSLIPHPRQVIEQPDVVTELTMELLSRPFHETYAPPSGSFPTMLALLEYINLVFQSDILLIELLALLHEILARRIHVATHSLQCRAYCEFWERRRKLEVLHFHPGLRSSAYAGEIYTTKLGQHTIKK
jgi:hypothetical protein